ncbi:helix-turn-helix domain-containing protein [Shewanella surugensis]|uniref:Helix-turn-helix transcriptional regulator n=1 Tax=Shewanella surugensis TaxID=212020 RepID=A0ABT0L6P6_9GAMM|nr:helix-turn-helix transcriptional regulator [Shewanella surugensis]MCL1123335.1 helix-turn-helix transcriptional regulator [Shewanella surugensis]
MSITLGEKFKLIRETFGLSQVKFAEKLEISLSSYKKYESGFQEVGRPALQKVASDPDCVKYALWLVADITNPEAGQIAPGDTEPEQAKVAAQLKQEEYEAQAAKVLTDALMMFCYLDWFTPNKDKMNFDDCAKLLLKDLQPVINQRFETNQKIQAIKSA